MNVCLSILTVFFTLPLFANSVSISAGQDQFLQKMPDALASYMGFPSRYGDNLASACFQFNTYSSPLIACNPKNPKQIVAVMNQDPYSSIDESGSFPQFFRMQHLEVAISASQDAGVTWKSSNIPLHVSLGGTVSDGVEVSSISWSPNGDKVVITGHFSDMRSGINNRASPESGIWYAESSDAGLTWKEAVLSNQPSDANPLTATIAEGTPTCAFDPVLLHHAYIAWDRPQYVTTAASGVPVQMYGNLYFSRSTDLAESFSNPVQMYDIKQDLGKNGQCVGVSLCATQDGTNSQNLVASFMRYYPTNGTSFDKTYETTTTDRVVVTSSDHGVSWDETATKVASFIYAQEYNPDLTKLKGLQFPPLDGSERSHMVQSPKTGRLYLVFQAGSLHATSRRTALEHPEIVLSRSKDFGKKWSKLCTVSKTYDAVKASKQDPLSSTAYQAFNCNIAWLEPNLVGIIYYDHRNYREPGVAATDVWVAIYKECSDDDGGSTGVGLDFVKEIRLTDQSFDANQIQSGGYISGGFGPNLGITAGDTGFFSAYSQVGAITSVESQCVQQDGENYCANVDTSERLTARFQKV